MAPKFPPSLEGYAPVIALLILLVILIICAVLALEYVAIVNGSGGRDLPF